jgi:hypothetical protein
MEQPSDWNDQQRNAFVVAWRDKKDKILRKKILKTARRREMTFEHYSERRALPEVTFWVNRHDLDEDLIGRWNFIRSRIPGEKGAGPRCEHDGPVQQCTNPRASGSDVPFCHFHLATEFAIDLAALLKGDAEKIAAPYAVGCLRLLVDERERNGPSALEAQDALKVICCGLLDWRPDGRSRRGRPGVDDLSLTVEYAKQYCLAVALRKDLKKPGPSVRNPAKRVEFVKATALRYRCGKRPEAALLKWLGLATDGTPLSGEEAQSHSDIAAIETARICKIRSPKTVLDRLSRPME